MSRTANLRRQHDAAFELANEILTLSEGPGAARNASRIALVLAKLTGLLRIHFAQEDRVIYPHMLQSADRTTAAVAHAFQAEMGNLGKQFSDYAQRWGSSRAIAEDFERFLSESKVTLNAVVQRMRRENAELYPLADALGTQGLQAAE